MLWTVSEVAEELGVARTTIYRWCDILGFKEYKPGIYLFTLDQVEQLRDRPDRRRKEWRDHA